MALKQFKAESKRLLDLMINSIYTNKEIFLRELISNASDAIDKLHFVSLTDEKARRDFGIRIERDRAARTLTVEDNGIGMNAAELESNLGTIAKSGTFDVKNTEGKDNADLKELIGQFGVGFYSCFMVADEVTVVSRKYGEDKAYKWVSKGASGYEVTETEREESGTSVTLKLKEDGEENYSKYLDDYTLRSLVKHYSDYIRYPITMQVEKIAEGKTDKAAKTLAYAEKVIPAYNVPLNYMSGGLDIAKAYALLGSKGDSKARTKASEITRQVFNNAHQYMIWYNSLTGSRFTQAQQDCMMNIYIMSMCIDNAALFDEALAKKLEQQFNVDIKTYQSKGGTLPQ